MKPGVLMPVLVTMAVAAGVAGYGYLFTADPVVEPEGLAKTDQAAHPATRFSTPAVPEPALAPWDQRISALATRLRNDYGDTIHEPATQAYLFVERQKLAEAYPEEGEALFEAAMAAAFPEFSIAILALMADMDRYHRWLLENELSLRNLSPMEREAALWQQRQAIFGARASLIWGQEESLTGRHAEAVKEELARLDQAHELTPKEVAHQLSTTIDSLYGFDIASQLVTPDALGQALFSMASVQQDLASMSAQERQQRMAALRRQMGYSDDQVERLGQLDRKRDERWQKGEAYMAERRQLTRRYQGEELQRALERLRRQHFGATAPTIAREEDQGFFRFQRERRYGLN